MEPDSSTTNVIINYPDMIQTEEKISKSNLNVTACYNNISRMLHQCFPDVCLPEQANVIEHTTYAEAVIALKKQQMLDDFTDSLESRMMQHILYIKRSIDGRKYRVLTYSTPYQDEMFLFVLESYQYGIMESLTAELFDSMENMFSFIKNCYLSLKDEPGWVFLEKQKPEEMFKVFL